MGLNGRLEDLPLLDIVQVVAFSQKTGYLTVETHRGEAAIVFERGMVVSCFTPDTPALPGEVAQVAGPERAAAIRKRIETALEELVRLREGQFLFSLTPEVPAVVNGREIRAETLEQGIKAEELLLELARGMDEDRRDAAAAVETGFAEAAETLSPSPGPEPAATAIGPGPSGEGVETVDLGELPEESAADRELPPLPELEDLPDEEGQHRVVLLVEDEADLRALLARAFIEGNWQVVEAGSPASAMRAARSLQDLGLPFVLVVDRGMPTSDGASFDGGLEVIRRLKQAGFDPPALLMTDRMTRTLQERGRKLGVARFVFKPSLSRLDPEQFAADIGAFGKHVRDTILPVLQPAAFSSPPGPETSLPRDDAAWREAAELQRRLEDLRRPQDAGQISALVMSMARDFFERGVLFIVKDDELRGLGGFGPAAHDDIVLVVREARIPLSEASIFQEVVATGRAHHGPLPAGRFEALLLDSLGAFAAREAAVMPLVANRETIALLYGDNPETGAGMKPLEALEIFLSQAGQSLERAFLQRKREARAGREAAVSSSPRAGLAGNARPEA
jgi:CheY-like chemotaxis protein